MKRYRCQSLSLWRVVALSGALCVVACSSNKDSTSNADGSSESSNPTATGGSFNGGNTAESPGDNSSNPIFSGAGGAGGAASQPLPPEQEEETSFQVPVATGHFVWSANPESGRVALVDVRTLDVRTIQAGLAPTFLAAVPDAADPNHNAAIVINTESNDATFFDESKTGELSSLTIPLHQGANSWAVSKDGRWALAWSNSQQVPKADPTEGFQDLTVIDLSKSPPVPTRLSVGYRPSKVVIDTASDRASVVTELGVSVISLGNSVDVQDFDFVDSSSTADNDISITPDGTLALAREEGSPVIRVVSLATGEIKRVELPSAVTDLDLTSDGSLAIAVVRQSSEVALLKVPQIFDQPTDVEYITVDGSVGSVTVSDAGDKAFIFSNAVESDLFTVLDLKSKTQRTVSLKAPLKAAFSAPDASHAIALLQTAVGSSRQGAFSVVPAATDLPPKIQSTDATPIAVAMVSDPVERGLVTVSDPSRGLYGVYVVRMPELRVDFNPLTSPPIATGVIAGEGIGYVAQQHAEGRISVIDLETGGVRTLTGFELAAKVVDGQ